jgi:hypothetical protein
MLGKSESDRKGILLRGFVTEIGKDFILVSVPRGSGIVHTFRIDEDYVPLVLEDLKIKDEVIIELSRREYCDIPVNLTDEEIKALPKSWHYDHNIRKVSVPCCLEKKSIGSLNIRKEIIEHILRESWRHGFDARVVDAVGLQEVYEIIEKVPRVYGKVVEEIKGKTPGVRVLIEVDTSMGKRTLKGFLPYKECSWLEINLPTKLFNIGEVIPLRIVSVRPLKLSRRRAFSAHALITGVQHIIGKEGKKIKQIIEGLDVKIDTKRETGKIIVEAPSEKDRDIACERIALEARRNPHVILGVWEKD